MGISPQRKQDLKDWVKKYITCKLLDVAYTASYVASAKVSAVGCALTGFGYGICYAAAQAAFALIIEETIGEARIDCWNQEDEILERFWGPFTFHRKYGG